MTARVTVDGKTLQLRVVVISHCNHGPSKRATDVYKNQAPKIAPDGTFNYSHTYRDLPPIPGFDQRFSERQHVSGSFSHGGRLVDGRDVTVETGTRGLTCRAAVRFRPTYADRPEEARS